MSQPEKVKSLKERLDKMDKWALYDDVQGFLLDCDKHGHYWSQSFLPVCPKCLEEARASEFAKLNDFVEMIRTKNEALMFTAPNLHKIMKEQENP